MFWVFTVFTLYKCTIKFMFFSEARFIFVTIDMTTNNKIVIHPNRLSVSSFMFCTNDNGS